MLADNESGEAGILHALQTAQEHQPHHTVQKAGDKFFPEIVNPDACYGIIGQITKAIEPHTEADPMGILMMLLTACGASIGSGPHYFADGAQHGVNLFSCAVGASGKGRKGTSWKQCRRFLLDADPDFEGKIASGLSSGEGLINLVRDATDGEDSYQGVTDKRTLIVESEFASPLKTMVRSGNTLSPVLRNAWDADRLQIATKNNPIMASNPHIAVIGHITREELNRNISETEAANGFGNRILWYAVRRSKCLPFGGDLSDAEVKNFGAELRGKLAAARPGLRYSFDPDAAQEWGRIYPALSEGKPGLLGAMINRAEAQVVRLSLLYAALDKADGLIRLEHLRAALAVWDYCEQSARWIFGERLGDATADAIFEALQSNVNGMSRTEISTYLGRNVKSDRIAAALDFLRGHGKARSEFAPASGDGGRPVERWFAITKETNSTNEG